MSDNSGSSEIASFFVGVVLSFMATAFLFINLENNFTAGNVYVEQKGSCHVYSATIKDFQQTFKIQAFKKICLDNTPEALAHE